MFDSFYKRLLFNGEELIYSYNFSSSETDILNNYIENAIDSEIVFEEGKTYAKIINNNYLDANQSLNDILFFDLSELIESLEDENVKIDLLYKEEEFFTSIKSDFYSKKLLDKVNEDDNYIFYLSEFDNIKGGIKTYESIDFIDSRINSIIINSVISCVILITLIIISFLLIAYTNSSLLKDIKTQKDAFQNLSNKDGLTDVFNRRYVNHLHSLSAN